jgi:Transcription factor WhiB
LLRPVHLSAVVLAVAKTVCRGCPVRVECLAEVDGDRFEVHGGLSVTDRQRLANGRAATVAR